MASALMVLRPLVRFQLAPRMIKNLRRSLVALSAAGAIAGILRLRGATATPPQGGGWRELSGPDLR